MVRGLRFNVCVIKIDMHIRQYGCARFHFVDPLQRFVEVRVGWVGLAA